MVDFNAAAVRFGLPGILRVAPLGTSEPTTYSSAWPAGWVTLGYTAEGSAFNYSLSSDNVEVAEELDILARVTTGRDGSVDVALAEMTRRNLNIAYNGGVVLGDGAAWEFEPPDLGEEVRVMLGWDAYADTGDNDLRFIFRKCFQSGSVSIENRKGATKSTIGVSFGLEKPTGAKIMKIMGASTLNPDDTP